MSFERVNILYEDYILCNESIYELNITSLKGGYVDNKGCDRRGRDKKNYIVLQYKDDDNYRILNEVGGSKLKANDKIRMIIDKEYLSFGVYVNDEIEFAVFF